MKWSEFFSSAITGAREAGIEIEADTPVKAVEQPAPAAADTSIVDTERKAQTEALAAAQAEIAKLKADAQSVRFGALVADFVGDAAAHLSIMAALGEDTPAFAAYVTQQKAHAEQIRQSNLFSDIGSAQQGAGSAWAQIEAKAKALMASDPQLTRQQAILKVAESDRDLYAAYKKEQ